MTYDAVLTDSPYTFTTQAIIRLDPSPGHQAFTPGLTTTRPQPRIAPPADETSLSHSGLLLAHALTLSDVRADRVAQLQQAIASGTYRIPAAAIAEKLVAAHQF